MSETLPNNTENTYNPWEGAEMPPFKNPGETDIPKVEVRELSPEDNLEQAAGLVYEVDPYICPDFFGDKDRAGKIGSVLFKDDGGLFSYKHTLIAEENGDIQGILIFADNTIAPWDCTIRKAEIEATGIEMPEHFDRANERYMKPVVEDAATLPDGVAEIEWEADPHYNELHLTVLADNPPAIGAYKKAGFEIVSSQTGYPDDSVATHNMVWRRPEA